MATLNALRLQDQLGFNDPQMRAVTQSIEQWLQSGETYPHFNWRATIHSHVYECYRQMFDGSEEAVILERTGEATEAIRTALNARKVDHTEQWIRDLLPPSQPGPKDQIPTTGNWFNGWSIILLIIGAIVLCAVFGSDNDNTSPQSACSPLSTQDERLRQVLVRDLEAGIILIPSLAQEVALTLPPKKGKELMDAAYIVANQTARTCDSFRPFVECVQDLSGNWWNRDEGTTTTTAPDLPTYKETYIAKASLIRRPQSALFLNLELLGSRTLEFSELVVLVTQSRSSSSSTSTATSAAKDERHQTGHLAREKLLNVLHHHQNAAQRGLYHVRQIKGHVAEGLTIVSSPSFSARQQEIPPTVDATSPKLAALQAAIASIGGQLRSWAVERSQRDKTLFSGDEAQRLWNSQGPMKGALLEEG
ncbi:MAG: hypothetical protein Q9173_005915 [Seirophora scorigena]